jgi:hypothetical protein
MLSYAAKTVHSRQELSGDVNVWVNEGIDRSGVLGVLAEVNQLSHKATSGNVSLQALLGMPPLTRYSSTNAAGAVLGPTVGTMQDLFSITSGVAGEWTGQDTRALRRTIPLQNLIGLRFVFDEAEEAINESLGVE